MLVVPFDQTFHQLHSYCFPEAVCIFSKTKIPSFQANLYSLSLRYEEPHMLVLSKTGKTVKVDEFLVPKTPTVKQPVEVKRRRRTPPPSRTDDFVREVFFFTVPQILQLFFKTHTGVRFTKI